MQPKKYGEHENQSIFRFCLVKNSLKFWFFEQWKISVISVKSGGHWDLYEGILAPSFLEESEKSGKSSLCSHGHSSLINERIFMKFSVNTLQML